MQPDPSRTSSETSGNQQPPSPQNTSQHGLYSSEHSSTPVPPSLQDHGGTEGSVSDWSISQSPSWGSASPDTEAWLSSPVLVDEALLQLDNDYGGLSHDTAVQDNAAVAGDVSPTNAKGALKNGSHFQALPEETLFQVISHLPANDLLTMKMVSRRFFHLVSSPHAWMNAFSQFFPGPGALTKSRDMIRDELSYVRTEKRQFTRLSSSTSWSVEYLLRTRLIRCLARGKPSLPFAHPSPGKPGRGNATFTFSSRLRTGCSNLHASFGQVLDKRKPQFVHGLASTGSVTSSDKKGKPDAWGFVDRVAFRHFCETHPGYAQWGLGSGELVGTPNVMDVSQPNGMVYGEGTPGGEVFLLGADDRHGRYLAPFLNISDPVNGLPRVNHDYQSICSVSIAKSAAIPQMTRGLVGVLSGSSNGIVSAYSLGPARHHERRFERGQITIRWTVSPGIPIVALAMDDHLSEERLRDNRVWAVAMNALGEVFALKSLPTRADLTEGTLAGLDVAEEVTAWQTGHGAGWEMITSSKREETPSCILETSSEYTDLASSARSTEEWIKKTPAEIRANFKGWDMRRKLEVDFEGDDGQGAGESVFLTDCGMDDSGATSIRRYTRAVRKQNTAQDGVDSVENDTLVRDAWSFSRFAFGDHAHLRLTAVAMDSSSQATTTLAEDVALRVSRSSHSRKAKDSQNHEDPQNLTAQVPGQRARLLAVGTSNGTIFVWNARAQCGRTSLSSSVEPVRIIQTDSPGISCLALSALYLVHGGEEGLVQAWDPLASTKSPIRTLSSRHAINNRRRAVIAAQQNPGLPRPHGPTPNFAAGAIALDPDTSILRGIVAIGGYLKYWSYSSVSAADDLSKAQKRNMRRAKRGLNSSPSETYSSSRRGGLKGFVDEELAHRELERKEQQAQDKQERRIAGRFGLDILGDGATDEQLLAYAKMVSEEDHQKHLLQPARPSLPEDIDAAELELRKVALSDEDLEKWKFASWEDRLRISAAATASQDRVGSETVPTADDDVAQAIQLSLRDSQSKTPVLGSSPEASKITREPSDTELDEAIARSLADDDTQTSPTPIGPRRDSSRHHYQREDDMARALRLSLEESSAASSPELDRRHNSASSGLDDAEFPALSSPSPPTRSTPSSSGRRRGQKGKSRAL
ncbi:MAG: hypothetical protein M1828_004268 [Chrysothrix sp. TS-e1954]|nr:MAG: hypothetical protein M1828_004268 [Chrysothrix sp. TS-e1954]